MLMAGPNGVPVRAGLLPLLDHRIAWAPNQSAACSPVQPLLRKGDLYEVVHTRALGNERDRTS